MSMSTRRISRRAALVGAGMAIPLAAGIDGVVVTPRRLVTTTHAIGRQSPDDVRLRIAQITDMHMGSLTPFYESLLERLHAVRPEVLVFTGDMIERPSSLAALDAFLGACPDVPSFASLGNWEYWSGVPRDDYRRLYEKNGIELLVNRSEVFSKDGRSLSITGLDDLVGGRPDPEEALAKASPSSNHLVLAHCPHTRDAIPLPAGFQADLMLSGHTHGGQIAPLGFACALPPGSGRYVAGWYRDSAPPLHPFSPPLHPSSPPLYVSRGIGTSMVPVRIGATPELAVFDWALA